MKDPLPVPDQLEKQLAKCKSIRDADTYHKSREKTPKVNSNVISFCLFYFLFCVRDYVVGIGCCICYVHTPTTFLLWKDAKYYISITSMSSHHVFNDAIISLSLIRTT
jgi:hypothetical protein